MTIALVPSFIAPIVNQAVCFFSYVDSLFSLYSTGSPCIQNKCLQKTKLSQPIYPLDYQHSHSSMMVHKMW